MVIHLLRFIADIQAGVDETPMSDQPRIGTGDIDTFTRKGP